MKKNKWTLGIVLAGLLLLSGGALALASGANFFSDPSSNATAQTVALENKGANRGTQVLGLGQKDTTVQPEQAAADSNQTGPTGVPSALLFNEQGSQEQANAQNTGAKEITSVTEKAVISSTPLDGTIREPNGFGAYGMMGGAYGSGYGMMGGYDGPNRVGLGSGYGMMGGGYNAQSLEVELSMGQVATAEQAQTLAKAYLQKVSPDLEVDELHEFPDSYEVEVKESATGAKAYEFVISKSGGYIYSEMGPNVMWNTKYGHMNWGNSGALTVSADQATQYAQSFVQRLGQEYSLEGPETAPGYYEFMILKDGKDYAELNVNGYSGQVWFETWHGPIVSTVVTK